MMDALSVVAQLRDLASEPQNREAIVQDQGCLPGLVLFLDHKDPKVLFATLQVGPDLIFLKKKKKHNSCQTDKEPVVVSNCV